MTRFLIKLCTLLLMCLPGLNPNQAHAVEQQLLIIVSRDSPAFNTAARRAYALSEAAFADSTIITPDKLDDYPHTNTHYLALGKAAIHAALERGATNTLVAAYLTRSTLQQSLVEHFNTPAEALAAGVDGLALDQPYRRYYLLASSLQPGGTAGTPLGPYLRDQRPFLTEAAGFAGLQLATVEIDENSNPVRVLEPLIKGSNVLVVLPDKLQVHKQSARWILELGYRYRTPVVAFSRRYTEIGAIASLYTSADDVGKDAARLLLRKIKTPASKGTIAAPESFTISINRSVARALRLDLQSETDYTAEIRRKEAGIE